MLRPKIMIVDDEKDILTIVEKYLQRWDFETEAFSDPAQALDRFKQDPGAFSLTLTDLRMPGIDGVNLAKAMVKLNQQAKILLMTAFEIDEDISDYLPSMRKEDIIRKPFKLTEICTAVKKHLEA
jgi:DNA-binding NtrC family response regulator